MTKKTMNIVEKYIDKLEAKLFFYKEGVTDRKKYVDDISKIYNEFENMVNSMYQYNLISEKDYKEVKPAKIWLEYLDK